VAGPACTTPSRSRPCVIVKDRIEAPVSAAPGSRVGNILLQPGAGSGRRLRQPPLSTGDGVTLKILVQKRTQSPRKQASLPMGEHEVLP
jgi:hypothetical protein